MHYLCNLHRCVGRLLYSTVILDVFTLWVQQWERLPSYSKSDGFNVTLELKCSVIQRSDTCKKKKLTFSFLPKPLFNTNIKEVLEKQKIFKYTTYSLEKYLSIDYIAKSHFRNFTRVAALCHKSPKCLIPSHCGFRLLLIAQIQSTQTIKYQCERNVNHVNGNSFVRNAQTITHLLMYEVDIKILVSFLL